MIEREAQIHRLLPLARKLARRVKQRAPFVDLDDLVAEGFVAAIRAVDTFDAKRGVKLETYAYPIVFGRIQNMAVRSNPAGQKVVGVMGRAIAARYRRALDLGRVPSWTEMESWSPTLRKARLRWFRANALSLDYPNRNGRFIDAADYGADPAIAVVAQMETDRLLAALDALTPRQQIVVTLSFFEGLSQHEIGRRIGVSAQNVNQLHQKALGKLRAMIA